METQELYNNLEQESHSAYPYGKEGEMKYSHDFEVYNFVINGSDVYLLSDDNARFGIPCYDQDEVDYHVNKILSRDKHMALILDKRTSVHLRKCPAEVSILGVSDREDCNKLGGRVEKHLDEDGVATFQDFILDDVFDKYNKVLTRATLHQYLYDTCVSILDS